MDFNQLMARMRELDQPTVAAPQVPVEECGEPMGMTPPMSNEPSHTPPSLSVNLNAQGMDDIESIMRLMTKVNPDMINQPAPVSMPPISAEPSIMSIKPPMPGLGNLDAGPLKMLPDLDKEMPGHSEPDADNMGGPSDMDADNDIDAIQKAMGDNDSDGDRDMDDRDMEKKDDQEDDAESEKDDEEKDEAWGNGLTGHDDVEFKGMDAAIPDGNDLNKPKQMTKHSYRQGDNPMAMEGEDLRAYVRSELQRRLNEAKGAK